MIALSSPLPRKRCRMPASQDHLPGSYRRVLAPTFLRHLLSCYASVRDQHLLDAHIAHFLPHSDACGPTTRAGDAPGPICRLASVRDGGTTGPSGETPGPHAGP